MANTVILLKYSSANGKPATLNTAEPAYSAVSNTLWINDGTSIKEIGGFAYTQKINEAASAATANVLVKRDTTGNAYFNYVIANNIVGAIPTTGVSAGTYGGQTKIPVITVSTDGRISYAANVNVATTLELESDNQFGNLNLLTETLRILGNSGISVALSDANNTFVIDADSTVIRTYVSQQTITGNVNVVGTIDVSQNVDAQNIIAYNKFYAGLATQSATPLPNLIAQFTSNSALYTQVNQQNIDGDGSADFVITADVGTDETFYTDLGMTGSTYQEVDTPFDPLTGYLLVKGNTGQVGGNMVIGTITPSTNIIFLVGGGDNSNVVAKLEETGLIITKGDITSNITTRTLNVANSAFDRANLAFDAANTANNFNQANVGAAIISVTANYQANVGAGRISDKASWEANSGAGIILANTNLKNYTDTTFVKLSSPSIQTISGDVSVSGNFTVTGTTTYINTTELNIGDNEIVLNADLNDSIPTQNAGVTVNRSLYTNTYIRWNEGLDYWVIRDNVSENRIATVEGYEANVGAARIADTLAAQANVGVGLITVTAAYQANVGAGLIANKADSDANVGALRIDFNTANSSLAANIGAARIADTLAAQANVGAGLIAVTAAYQANVGAGLIANKADSDANVGAGLITVTSAYQANVGSAIQQGQANVGAGLIAVTAAYQANVGAGLIANKADSDANVGAGLITVTSAYQANVGVGLITLNNAITAAYQANVGAGLITVTAAYQANVGAGLISNKADSDANTGALKIDFNTANSSLAANIGAARIADALTAQANVGAGLIAVTAAYQANVGAARIADTLAAQANVGAGLIAVTASYEANVGAGLITNKADSDANVGAAKIEVLGRADSAFAQANLAYNKANIGGDFSGFANVTSNVSVGTYLDLNTNQSNPSHKEGRIFYNNTSKSVSYFNESNDEIELGQKYSIRVWNNTASAISDGSAVYINGTSANGIPSVALANASSAMTSEVIGLATISIPAGAYGYVVGAGKIDGLDTSLLSPGQELYLSATTAGGYTTVAPAAPAVPVTVGYVVLSDLINGTILVNIHLMEGRNKSNGGILFGRNEAIDEDPTHLYWDFANNRLGINTDTPQANLHVAGETLLSGNVTITGNLAISNAQSITTTELTVGGNVIILNSEFTGTPTVNAEIIVNRGDQPNVYITWDEQINEWIMFEDAGYAPGHILHSEKTAHTWADYTNMAAYEKLTHPIGADLANTTNETAKAAFTQANTAITSGQANVGAAVISVTSAYQANVGAGLIANKADSDANVGAGLITVTAAYQANVGAGLIANKADSDANVGALRIDFNTANSSLAANIGAARITDALAAQANVGAGLIAVTAAYQANVGSAIQQGQANVGAGLITVTSAYQANVGAGLIAVTAAYQANVGSAIQQGQANVGTGLIAVTSAYEANVGAVNLSKVSKSGDVMTGSLTTSSSLTGSTIVANTSVTINTHSAFKSTSFVTSSTNQFTLDSFSTSLYRSAKYLIQMSSGTSYHTLELNLVHDDTEVYITQYGEVKSGASLGTFDASISGGILSLLATANNAVTTFKAVSTFIVT